MTIKSWGTGVTLNIAEIAAEFAPGKAAPHALRDFLAGGSYVPAGTIGYPNGVATTIPSGTSALGIYNFYGASKRVALSYVFSSNTVAGVVDISTLSGYVNGGSDLTVTINTGIYLRGRPADVVQPISSPSALSLSGFNSGDTLKIVNRGYIIGGGGRGSSKYYPAFAGNEAISITGNFGWTGSITIDNTLSTAYIGGGGGGGGGSFGTDSSNNQWNASGGSGAGFTSGALNVFGVTGQNGTVSSINWPATGFGAAFTEYTIGGGEGGTIIPGTGGTSVIWFGPVPGRGGGSGGSGGSNNGLSGAGGSGSSAGGTSAATAGGGGGWGAAGGGGSSSNGWFNPSGTVGAAGGPAVKANGRTITWTGGNTTRVYGRII